MIFAPMLGIKIPWHGDKTLLLYIELAVSVMQVSASVSAGWINLDFWSEMYVGTRWLVVDELPQQQWQGSPRHGPLSQMVLLSSHHLVEVMLFSCIKKVLDASPGKFPKHEKKFAKATFHEAFYEWPVDLFTAEFNFSVEPYKSARRLHDRRNATIHKDSALTSLPMARSALFSAVETSREIANHAFGQGGFKYQAVLQKYPLGQEPWFSDVKFIDRQRV